MNPHALFSGLRGLGLPAFCRHPLACLALGLACTAPLSTAATPASAAPEKPARMIVLTDIEADPDDTQSLVRLFLYANEIDLKGLVATTSVHRKSNPAPESIHALVSTYARVQPNLLRHDPRYPDATFLDGLITTGSPEYGMAGVGPGKDSAGSARIIQLLGNDDPRPLWISVWGGANTLAQALHTLRATKTPEELARLIAKLRVYTISDQDDSGQWLRKEFPDLFYIVSPGGYGAGTWTGIHTVVPGIDNATVSNPWLATNIQQGHGPLGAAYPDVAYGMEGDTPAWLALIPNGLNAPEHPDWGGWGGRYQRAIPALASTDPQGFTGGVPVEQETRPIWTNAIDTYTPPVRGEYGRNLQAGEKTFSDFKTTLWRWRDDFQNDFAARMDWTTQSPENANHPPVPALAHAEAITVRSGAGFSLSARGSTDPDGDSLTYYWFQYPEAGSYKGAVPLRCAENLDTVWIVAPEVTQPETLHYIVRVTDKGTPALTRYRRVVVTVTP